MASREMTRSPADNLGQQLRGLNMSSPQFLDQLTTLLSDKGLKDYIRDLQDDDVASFVDCLNTVCTSSCT